MFNLQKHGFFEIYNNPPINAIPTTIAMTPIEISINLDMNIM
jgi:hypothetical protein